MIVTTANSWAAWQRALELARLGTRIAVLGFPGRSEGPPPFNPLASAHFYSKQLSVLAAGTTKTPERLHDNLRTILRLTAEGRLPIDRLITHRVPWSDLGGIYELGALRTKSLVAAVLNWQ